MRHAVLLTLCLAATAAASGSKPAVKVIDGKEVVAGPAIAAQPLVEVRDLRFFACTLASNKADCTVVVGNVIPHMAPERPYVLTVRIELYEVYGPTISLQHRGTVQAVLDRPKAGIPTRFVALGPPWYSKQARREEAKPATAHYTTQVTVHRWKPPQPEPLKLP